MLKLEKITKVYKTDSFSQKALNKVSLSFRKNEFVSILGPSGSGKTTLLNIVGGLDDYTSGDLVINGIMIALFDDVSIFHYQNQVGISDRRQPVCNDKTRTIFSKFVHVRWNYKRKHSLQRRVGNRRNDRRCL